MPISVRRRGAQAMRLRSRLRLRSASYSTASSWCRGSRLCSRIFTAMGLGHGCNRRSLPIRKQRERNSPPATTVCERAPRGRPGWPHGLRERCSSLPPLANAPLRITAGVTAVDPHGPGDYKRCAVAARLLPPLAFYQTMTLSGLHGPSQQRAKGMANTSSARKATRKIARRTEINKGRRSKLRNLVRSVEEAIVAGDRSKALAALKEAEPVIMRSAQKGIVHRNAASRKVSRLSHRVAKLGA